MPFWKLFKISRTCEKLEDSSKVLKNMTLLTNCHLSKLTGSLNDVNTIGSLVQNNRK